MTTEHPHVLTDTHLPYGKKYISGEDSIGKTNVTCPCI